MSNNYIVNGDVQRGRIAMDIKYRKLKSADIESICNDPRINGSFFGSAYFDSTYKDKKSKQYWNKEYLDLISYAAVASCFNRDYLIHLDEVADFVSKKATFKKVVVAGTIVVLVIIAGVIVLRYVL